MRVFLIFIMLFLSYHLSGSEIKEDYQIITDKSNLELLNPYLKNREITKLRLNNALRIYIISDEKADQSAAALGVMVGSWEDPKEYPGMAHFCEHMLFKGSKKYPDESGYFRYIFDHGGTPNAFTAPDKTVYMFSINNDAFEGALDRLAHFFIDPVFNNAYIARELYAVDQEHSKNIENDDWRRFMIFKEIANQKHPISKFSTGNAKTLGGIPPRELRGWYERNYSSNLMTLVIYSPLKTDELIQMVVEKFQKIPNLGKDPFHTSQNLFSKENSSHIVYIKPIKNLQILAMEFELDKSFANDDSKSADLIAYTLKRGQKSSLLEVLKSEKLAEDIDISAEKIGNEHIIFSIEVTLTDQGLVKKDLVIKRLFEAINNLKSSGIPPYLFHEMNTMAKLNYQYQSHTNAFEFVTEHATALMNEDLDSYPRKSLLASKYNSKNVFGILDQLTPSNCQFYVIADPEKSNIKMDIQEKWMRAEYSIKPLDRNFEKTLVKQTTNSDIKLPDPNPFLPTNLKITPTKNSSTTQIPLKIVDSDNGKLFFLKDDIYNVPEIAWTISIKDANFKDSPRSIVLKELFIKALNEKLDPIIFSAEAAGLNPYILADGDNIKIIISGYSEKANLLLQEILKAIKTLNITKDQFEIYLNSLYKSYANKQKVLPMFQANEILSSILISTTYRSDEKLSALKHITYRDYLKFQNSLFEKNYIEGFLAGNLTLKDAESIWLDIQDTIGKYPFPKSDHIPKKVITLSQEKGPYVIHKKTPLLGNGVILLIDQGKFTHQKRASQNILSSALKEAFFTELRSKQKTAYIAHSKDLEIERELFQIFAVQSNSHNVTNLITRFEIFIEDYIQDLSEHIPQERFENIKENVITTLEMNPKNLQDLTFRLNLLAYDYDEDFYWLDKRIEALKELSYEDFLSTSKDFLSIDNKKRMAILFEGVLDKEKEFSYLEISENDLPKVSEYNTR